MHESDACHEYTKFLNAKGILARAQVDMALLSTPQKEWLANMRQTLECCA